MQRLNLALACSSLALATALLGYQNQQGELAAKQVKVTWTIEGNVMRGSQPVTGATVISQGPQSIPWATTDETGHYVLQGTVFGNYLVRASKAGQGVTTGHAVNIVAGAMTAHIDLHLIGGGSISGRVLDSDRNTLPGTFVAAFTNATKDGQPRLELKAHTDVDSSGEYTLTDLSDGRYYILVSRALTTGAPQPVKREDGITDHPPGLATRLNAFYPNSESVDGATPIRIEAGERRGGVDVTLNRVNTFCVMATVADVPGAAPHQKASFQIYQAMGTSFPTIASGSVRVGEEVQVCDIPSGAYRSIATTGNQEPLTDVHTYKTTGFVRTDFLIGKRDVNLKTLYSNPGVPIRGTVSIEGQRDGDVFPKGITIALDQQGRPVFAGEDRIRRVDEQGDFFFETVLLDQYRVRVSGLPQGFYVRSATQQNRDVLKDPVTPGDGDLRIVVSRNGVVVSGQSVTAENLPAGDAMVVLMSADQNLFTQQSDQNGNFQFGSGLAPGKYRLLALAGLLEGEEQDLELIKANLRYATDLDLPERTYKTTNVVVHSVR